MKNKWLKVVLIFSLVLNFAVIGTLIYNKITRDQRSWFAPESEFAPFKEMKLDKDQRRIMFELIHDFRSSTREESKQISSLEKELFNAIHTAEFDSAVTSRLIDQISQRRLMQSQKAINYFQKFKKVLSPEQQAHFLRMILEYKPGRGKGHRDGMNDRELFKKKPPFPDSLKR